jgi:hypothetical protein
MKPDGEKERLKALFCELKREDERRAPPVARVWQAAASRRSQAHPRTLWGVAAAAAAAVVLVTAGVIGFGHRPPVSPVESPPPPIVQSPVPPAPPPAELGISWWESPTAFLLEPPARSSPGGGPV